MSLGNSIYNYKDTGITIRWGQIRDKVHCWVWSRRDLVAVKGYDWPLGGHCLKRSGHKSQRAGGMCTFLLSGIAGILAGVVGPLRSEAFSHMVWKGVCHPN